VPVDPLVSVLLPVWNGERFLRASIDSIASQTFRAFELIVISDGSTDGSLEIAREAAGLDSRIVVLPLPHDGLPAALNAGIAAARGAYLARMDADDLAVPARLERQVAYLDAHPHCVVVGSAVDVVDAQDEHLGIVRFPAAHADIVGALAVGRTGLAHPAVLMRREAVAAAGGYRANAFPSEDLDLWLRIRHHGEFANLDEPLLRYRRHPAAVGIRERGRQQATIRALVAKRRAARDPSPAPPVNLRANGAAAGPTYHFECARVTHHAISRRGTAYAGWAAKRPRINDVPLRGSPQISRSAPASSGSTTFTAPIVTALAGCGT